MKEQSELIKKLMESPEKLAYAIKDAGYCPGDFLDGMPSCNTGHCVPLHDKALNYDPDKCLKCWSDRL